MRIYRRGVPKKRAHLKRWKRPQKLAAAQGQNGLYGIKFQTAADYEEASQLIEKYDFSKCQDPSAEKKKIRDFLNSQYLANGKDPRFIELLKKLNAHQ